MVIADGSGSNETYAATFEQCGIASCACAYDECVGIVHQCIVNVAARYVYGIYTHHRQCLADIGNLIIYDNFHGV